jgi:lipoprotein NlpI
MRILSVLVATAALFAATAPAAGASRADWDACKGDDPDRSIAACTRIIQGRGETAKDSAIAHHERGLSYKSKGDFGRAIADFSEAIRLEPKFADAYLNRGLAYLYSGTLDKALADVSEASELDPQDAYDAYKALWADIVAQRNKASSHLSQASAGIDMTPWPAPIIRSFLGRMPPEAVLAAADDPDTKKKKNQVCEANFYGGELALRLGAKDEAVRLFRLAASGCAKDVNEWFAANAELKALGETP